MHTRKRFTVGTHRALHPSEMLERVSPLVVRAGITRVANVTGLDRVGLPTVLAIRPTAATLAVASGKGLTVDTARVSALMEAIEMFHAETAYLEEISLPYAELASVYAVVDPLGLPLLPGAVFASKLPRRWSFGQDLLEGTTVAVPSELVSLSAPGMTLSPFHVTSNGLASGAVYIEALASALLELVERDAVGCWHAAWLSGAAIPRVRLDSAVCMPLVQQVLEQLADARVRPVAFDCTVNTGIPVYRVELWDELERHVGLYRGSGAHLDPEIALLRALTEAVQSRAVYIAASRDDFSGRDFVSHKAQDIAQTIDAIEAQPATVDLRNAQSIVSSTFEADIRLILERLRSIGVRRVVTFDLTLPAFREALAVVRVVATGLAGTGVLRGYPSPRAEAFALRAAA